MDATLSPLKVRFVARFSYIQQANMLGHATTVKQFEGELHLFETFTDDKGKVQLMPFSFCGMERSKIGELTADTDKRPPLPMCQTCEANWKNDARSPWRAWDKAIVAHQ